MVVPGPDGNYRQHRQLPIPHADLPIISSSLVPQRTVEDGSVKCDDGGWNLPLGFQPPDGHADSNRRQLNEKKLDACEPAR